MENHTTTTEKYFEKQMLKAKIETAIIMLVAISAFIWYCTL